MTGIRAWPQYMYVILLYLHRAGSDAETTDSLHQNKLLSWPLSLITASAFCYTSAFVSVSLCTSSAIFPCILFNILTISLFTSLSVLHSIYSYLPLSPDVIVVIVIVYRCSVEATFVRKKHNSNIKHYKQHLQTKNFLSPHPEFYK